MTRRTSRRRRCATTWSSTASAAYPTRWPSTWWTGRSSSDADTGAQAGRDVHQGWKGRERLRPGPALPHDVAASPEPAFDDAVQAGEAVRPAEGLGRALDR